MKQSPKTSLSNPFMQIFDVNPPMPKTAFTRKRLKISLALAQAFITPIAIADCLPSTPANIFVCSGTTTTPAKITTDNASVSTAPGFSSTIPYIAGSFSNIDIQAFGQLSFTDVNASNIVSNGTTGILISGKGDIGGLAGSVNVDVNSNITAPQSGIRAFDAGSGDLSITSRGLITTTGSGGYAIYAENKGGNLKVETFGLINSKGQGINATNGASITANSTQDLTVITHADINAGTLGITTTQLGDGATHIITHANVSGTSSGIAATSNGSNSGDLNITTNGNVSSSQGQGVAGTIQNVLANTPGGKGNLNITTNGTINSFSNAIFGYNSGTGKTNVQVFADATSTSTATPTVYLQDFNSANGISFVAHKNVSVQGGSLGLSIASSGLGTTEVTNHGFIKGVTSGVLINHSGTATTGRDITINNDGTISGNVYGLSISSKDTGNTQITNQGTINWIGSNPNLLNAGITVTHTGSNGANRSINIDNSGTIRTLTGDTNKNAITTNGSPTTLNNEGTIIGAITTSQLNDMINLKAGSVNGAINTRGGDDTVTQTGGTTTGIIATSTGNDTVTLSGGTLSGEIYMGAGTDRAILSGGNLIGSLMMDGDDDIATLTGTVDITQAPQFDGGIGTDTLNIDGLSARGFTAASNDATGNDLTKGNNLTGWETINVQNGGTLKLSDHLFTANNTGVLNIDGSSTLDLKGNSPGVFTISGNVNNSGMMTMADGAADDVTTITGNYTGVAGSRFAIDTVLGDDSSLTDKLVVNGSTSGTTALEVTNVGGTGAQTVEGIQVVQVDGASDGTFTLAAPVQGGSYEYLLYKNGVSTPTDGDWYLRSTFVATCANTPSLCPVDPVDPVDPPKPPVYIYRPGVAAYVTAQSANADAAFLQMATLHQRMGEQRDLPTDKAQTWGRLIGGGVSSSGKNRFEYDQTTTGFQFGRDLLHKTSSIGTQQRAGVTVQYTHSSMDAKDRVRPLVGLGEDTGSMSSDSVGVGGYYTRMNQAGAYLDVVGQVNHLSNKFDDSYGGRSKQKAWQFGLSAEVGKPVADLGGWKFEPQAQLSYLLSQYDDFSDAYSNIDGLNASQLRGRLGLRVYKDMVNCDHNVQYYGVLNLHHDFLKSKAVTLHDRVGSGSASVRESFDRTFGEVGVGIQGQIKNNTYVYADARYQRSFKGNKEGAQFNIGVKANF